MTCVFFSFSFSTILRVNFVKTKKDYYPFRSRRKKELLGGVNKKYSTKRVQNENMVTNSKKKSANQKCNKYNWLIVIVYGK